MLSTTGIIFANIHDNNISELTSKRTIASVPYACRYRFIDFTLSNMVNSGINNIDIITQANYHSLMDHLGSGKDWDLARREGGLKILPPFIAPGSTNTGIANTRLEALKNIAGVISSIKDEYVVLSDCDVICNVDIREMIETHEKSGSDLTVAVKKVNLTKEEAKKNVIMTSNENGRIVDVSMYPNDFEGEADISLNMIVMKASYLRQCVSEAISHGYTSLSKDIIIRNMGQKNFNVYKFDGYFAVITSMEDYFKCSMDLITKQQVGESLFVQKSRPIYTKVRNLAPTYYEPSSSIKDSMLADGCIIEGTVENSILFRGVKVAKGAVVRNSILMQDTVVLENASLNCVITDKNVVIREGRNLSGAETQPFYVEKGKMI